VKRTKTKPRRLKLGNPTLEQNARVGARQPAELKLRVPSLPIVEKLASLGGGSASEAAVRLRVRYALSYQPFRDGGEKWKHNPGLEPTTSKWPSSSMFWACLWRYRSGFFEPRAGWGNSSHGNVRNKQSWASPLVIPCDLIDYLSSHPWCRTSRPRIGNQVPHIRPC
jgi:hypothetical protein